MTVRVERVVEVSAPPADVWSFIADPEKRARSVSVVTDYDDLGDGKAVWHVKLPIPVINRTISVETEDRTRDPPQYVEFVGKSKVMRVVGEHTLEEQADDTRLTNRFVVDGKLPGVERFFKRNLEAEFDNLERELHEDLGLQY
ncbi:MAG: carbon monoxide dehydrogenase subunit G [Natronomonas sp.]|jgi:carbon monoxide dehydrogenase subunit G